MPLSRTRSESFDELVLDAVEDVEDALRDDPDLAARVTAVELGVEEVPPEDVLAAAEAGRELPLARGEADAGGTATRLIVYRRPVELRAVDPDERARLVHEVVVDALADLLAVPVERLDPGLGD